MAGELRALGWNERLDDLWEQVPGDLGVGRVVRADRGRVLVQTAGGLVTATANPAGWPTSGGEGAVGGGPGNGAADATSGEVVPTTGDWVTLALADPEVGELATVAGVLPRSSRIARIDALGRDEQVLAANVDHVLVVHGLDRPLRAGRIERSLVLAWESGASPVLVVTKADLPLEDGIADQTMEELRSLAGEAPVHLLSSRTGKGVDALRPYLEPNRTLAMLGESGAGKSALVNRLVGREAQTTGEVREGDSKGRHTTVTRDLVVVPGGGVLVDTPGLRSMGLWDAYEGLAQTYADIEELAEGCRFRDCAHTSEPGCAVRAAVAGGELQAPRLERYLEMHREAAEVEARRDERARSERKRQDKVSQKAFRSTGRDKRGPGSEPGRR